MIKDLKEPTIEDMIEAFKAREKEIIEPQVIAHTAEKAQAEELQRQKERHARQFYDMVCRVLKPLVDCRRAFITDLMDGSWFRVWVSDDPRVNWNSLSESSNSHVYCDSDKGSWCCGLHLNGERYTKLKADVNGVRDLDGLTVKLCHYVGRRMAHIEGGLS